MTEEEYTRWRNARLEGIKERFPFVLDIHLDSDPRTVTAWFILGGRCHFGSLEQLEEYCAKCEKALIKTMQGKIEKTIITNK